MCSCVALVGLAESVPYKVTHEWDGSQDYYSIEVQGERESQSLCT